MAVTPALEGVRVIDFGQYMAGPMAAMLLGDQGADVIRIDPPGGPRWSTAANATWNRNKRSIVLDLKKEADNQIARKLIGTADVVIENFRPGVMDRLGLGAAAMTAANPRLVYCSLPGFGADDPRAHVRAWEGVLGAATGAYRPNPAAAGDHKDQPVYTVIPYASAAGAFLCAVTVAMALNARERSGAGQRVEIPLFDATFYLIGARGLLVNGKPSGEHHFPWNRQVLCKDGRWLMYDGSNKKAEAFLKHTGLDKWRDAGLSETDLLQKFDEVMLARPAKEWEDLISEIGSEGVICHTSAEWLQHPQARESQIIADYDDPELGRFRGPGIGTRLSRTPGSVRRPRPRTDQHRDEILAELAAFTPRTGASAPAGREALRAALEGVKVVDLCIVLAGPTCGRTMAEFGADVIKIDSPHVPKVLRHNDTNRGKRSVLIDLKKKEGLELFWKIVDNADVVLQNFREGVAEKLGVGYEQVRARRPDIVYGSVNTYGHLGAYSGRPGHEPLGQAVAGMQARLGSKRPTTGPFSANDYGTGLMACYGVALALLHRRRTGEGQFVDSALTYAATMLQSALLQDYPGKQWNEPHGQEAVGSGPLNRLYQARDGWLFLAARPGELSHCVELADLSDRGETELEQALATRLRERPVAFWVEALTKAGIGAHRNVPGMVQLMTDPLTVARGLAVTRDHEGFGPITTTAPAVKLSRTPVMIGAPASKPGKDIPGVLEEIGMSTELDRLIRERVIAVDGVKAGC
jgi:crotonobetainyl-CoA:carnitine CoA-transferase CaiB-like acyl-CoA transferase